MKSIPRWLSLTLIVALLAGCLPNAAVSPSKKSIQSEKPREAAPQVAQSDRQALAAGNNAFAMDLYHALGAPQGNFFYSPYSISLALAMTYAGARGQTAEQMAQALHFMLPPAQLHPAFNGLDQEIGSRKNTPGQGSDGKGFRLNVTNDIWGQQDYTFRPEFLDILAQNYGAGLRGMDFKSDPAGARQAINDYIARQTEQRIKDLIPPNAIDPSTRLVLTNAIYFNAAWLHPFEKDLTKDQPFTRLDGSQISAPRMVLAGNESMAYAAGQGFQAVALPYEGGQLSMLILVPDPGKFADFEAGLDAARLEGILSQMQYASVHVEMPKFKTESSFSLKQTLEGLGMPLAFDPSQADFSGMGGQPHDLYISEAVHKAFVKVDESGTEAAAATAVMMAAGAAPMQPVRLTIDHPFIFLIRDEPTNTVLFVGRVVDPGQ